MTDAEGARASGRTPGTASARAGAERRSSAPGRVAPGPGVVRFYGAAANLVMITHFAVSIFIVFGGLLVLFGVIPWWTQVPFALWGFYVHVANVTCPLTPLEKACRARAGEQPYEAGFVARYLAPAGLSGRRLDYAVATLILVANAIIYGVVLLSG